MPQGFIRPISIKYIPESILYVVKDAYMGYSVVNMDNKSVVAIPSKKQSEKC